MHLPAAPELDPTWILVEDGFLLAREHEIESLFAIGNGFVGSRAALAEGSPLSSPATFVAGVYDCEPGGMPGLARAPDWSHVSATMNGSTLRIDQGQALEHRRTLDMRQGILWRRWRHRDPAGRVTRIEGLRLASLADRHLLAQSITLTPENYSGPLMIASDATLSHSISFSTSSGLTVHLVASGHVEGPDGTWTAPAESGSVERWQLPLDLGCTYRLDRLACVYVSRGAKGDGKEAQIHLDRYRDESLEHVVDLHRRAWAERWDHADVVIEGDDDAQRALRFAIYHLVSAANPDDDHVSIGARALTGGAYRGHVFWDTEIYMLPFFTLAWPAAARALLMYRWHTLPAARRRAAAMTYGGALYAWESADSGADVTPSFVVAPTGEVMHIHVREQEQHISADIAYAVWRYWQATADSTFLLDAGAEILIETARFWASRVREEPDGRYHIRGVIGPDEYHESVDDDAYTNGMARFNLEIAAQASSLVLERWPDRGRALGAMLHLDSDEPPRWLEIARRMYDGFDPRTGLIEQFQGYFALEDIDLSAFEPRLAPMDLLLGRERVQRSQVIKQPDVLMLVYLLWDRFPPEIRERNFLYYEPRTSHGSSLSPPIHAALAARLGFTELAQRYFDETAQIDLGNRMGNAAGGVHVAALAGLWQAAVFGFGGVSLDGDRPIARPRLPPSWLRLGFELCWRGERIRFDFGSGACVQADREARP